MHPHGMEASRTLGPLTDTAFVRRSVLERDGLPDPDFLPSVTRPVQHSWDARVTAALSWCLEGARAWVHRHDASAQAREDES